MGRVILAFFLGPVGDDRADFGGGGEQGRRLCLDHLEIILLCGVGVVGGDKLVDLAFGNDR